MSQDLWYYCHADRDDETCHGPVPLAQLAELIRTERLPYDVLVSPLPFPGSTWVEADTVGQILEAIPLDRERLVREYLAYGEAPPGEENWGWASDRMYSILENIPELAWSLIVEMLDRARSDDALGFVAASPLEDLLSGDGPEFIDRVEKRATESPQFRRALGMLRRLGMTDDVWQRVQKAAGT
jgi:hypothetical protein